MFWPQEIHLHLCILYRFMYGHPIVYLSVVSSKQSKGMGDGEDVAIAVVTST